MKLKHQAKEEQIHKKYKTKIWARSLDGSFSFQWKKATTKLFLFTFANTFGLPVELSHFSIFNSSDQTVKI